MPRSKKSAGITAILAATMGASILAGCTSDPATVDPILLSVIERRENFEYKLRMAAGGEIGVFCNRFSWQNVVVWSRSGSAVGHHIRCGRDGDGKRKLLIWVHGGPWAYAGTDLVLEQLAFLEAGYDIFVPLYPGSSDRPTVLEGSRMVPDIVDAMEELRAAVKWGHRNYRTVDVLGESFGAFLAVSVAHDLHARDALFLVNPSLGGKRTLFERYARKGDGLEISGVEQDAVQRQAVRITETYFARLGDYDPIRRLSTLENVQIKLIYGGRDPLLVRQEIEFLVGNAVPGCGVEYRPQSEHEFGYKREHFQATRALIQCSS